MRRVILGLAVAAGVRAWAVARSRLDKLTDESRLRTPDRGPVQPQSEMAGEAEPAGVGEPLTVEHHDVGLRRQFRERGEERRALAEREEAGHVRERDRFRRDDL